MANSSSVGVLEQDADMHFIDQDIIGLTQDVKNFSNGLAKLKRIFNDYCECDEDLKVLAHEQLGNVLSTLKSLLKRYPPLNTTEIFSAAGSLITKIKNYNYEDPERTEGLESAFSDAIDQLALEFSNSVSDYLMEDLHNSYVDDETTQDKTEKDDTEEDGNEMVVHLSAEQIDAVFMSMSFELGLELAFQRAKAWSKYMKDVAVYIEKRAQLEVEYSKNLSKLAISVKPTLTEEAFLPLQSVYCTVLSQDVEYAKTCQETFTLIQISDFVEPINVRRNEHDKVRRSLKETWNKEVKKMQEAMNNLRKSQTMYITRQQEYEKAKELSQKTESDLLSHSLNSSNLNAKVDKKKKAEDEALHKAAEAETTYKACIAETNSRHTDIQKMKKDLLATIREQIYLSDQIIKTVTVQYFQLLQTVSARLPVQYHTLCETSKIYEPGSQYNEYVRRLPTPTSTSVQYEFKFEPYNSKVFTTRFYENRDEIDDRKTSIQSSESMSSEGSPTVPSQRKTDRYRVPVTAWGPQSIVTNSDFDSHNGSNKSQDSSPSSSPYPLGQKMFVSGSVGDLIKADNISASVEQLPVVLGTELMDVQSLLKKQGCRRNTTFGVDFQQQVEYYHSPVPPIVLKCLQEVENRGITVKGIYRVSGVKSIVENLCQKFENDPESVDLQNENPNVISNVLKLYLRELPEPLLTFKLYDNFVEIAKQSLDNENTIDRLHKLIDDLPLPNRKMCAVLMHHLKRVAVYVEQNQMNESNLGIVFGPTLLRPQGDNALLKSLIDAPHQKKAVELLIIHAEDLFGPVADHQLMPVETPVEPMEMNTTPLEIQQATSDLPKDSVVQQEPNKETMPSLRETATPNMQQSSLTGASMEQSYNKKLAEEMLLPGSANFDQKDSYHTSADVFFRSGTVTHQYNHLTPPLMTRHITKPIPSPASSPNLSALLTMSIEEMESPKSAPSTNLSTPTRVFHLSPVNDWIPKRECLFNKSILDPRSPKIYRQTVQPQDHSSRDSWPKSSKCKCMPQKCISHEKESDTKLLLLSPKLVRKCANFDLERSKPFPSRSHITSPNLVRRVVCMQDADTVTASVNVHESPTTVT